jgi:hypothetical protein
MHLGRVGWSVVCISALALAAPGVAGAHIRLGALAVDVRVDVSGTRLTRHPVFAISVDPSDRALHLFVKGGHRVVVIGYLGEPVLRDNGREVAVNLASPTAAAAGLLVTSAEKNESGTAVWRDPRLRQLPAGTSRVRWSIPLVVDGRRTLIIGDLRRVPPPRLWRWLLLAFASAAAAGWSALGRDPHRLRTGCVLLGGTATVAAIVAATAFALDADTAGSRPVAVYLLLFVVGGTGFAVWGPREVRVAATAWLGVVALMTGLAFSQMFFHGAVLSVLPATITRAAGALAIGAGAAAAALGGLYYARADAAAKTSAAG